MYDNDCEIFMVYFISFSKNKKQTLNALQKLLKKKNQ